MGVLVPDNHVLCLSFSSFLAKSLLSSSSSSIYLGIFRPSTDHYLFLFALASSSDPETFLVLTDTVNPFKSSLSFLLIPSVPKVTAYIPLRRPRIPPQCSTLSCPNPKRPQALVTANLGSPDFFTFLALHFHLPSSQVNRIIQASDKVPFYRVRKKCSLAIFAVVRYCTARASSIKQTLTRLSIHNLDIPPLTAKSS